MDFNEQKISSSQVFDGKLLKVFSDKVKLPNGKEAVREYIKHNGGACVIVEKDDKILLVKQFRYPFSKPLLEIPAGKLNDGESPEQTAKRELEEECGFSADKVELIFEMYPTPAYTSEITYIFKAYGLKQGKVNLDEDEFLQSVWVEKDKLRQMIKNKEIKDGKTLIALLYVL